MIPLCVSRGSPSVKPNGLTRQTFVSSFLLPLILLNRASNPIDVGADMPRAIIAGGFKIPANQYTLYKETLNASGFLCDILEDQNGFSNNATDSEGVQAILDKVKKSPPSPIVLIGHSRGGRLAVLAAAELCRSSHKFKSNLRCLILFDPVDDPSTSALPSASLISVPTAIISLPYSGESRYYHVKYQNVCAPPGADASTFYESLPRKLPKLLMTIEAAGHLQLLERRAELTFSSVCGVGKMKDPEVSGLCSRLAVAWSEHWTDLSNRWSNLLSLRQELGLDGLRPLGDIKFEAEGF